MPVFLTGFSWLAWPPLAADIFWYMETWKIDGVFRGHRFKRIGIHVVTTLRVQWYWNSTVSGRSRASIANCHTTLARLFLGGNNCVKRSRHIWIKFGRRHVTRQGMKVRLVHEVWKAEFAEERFEQRR